MKMMRNIIACIFLLQLVSCGGGSEGTGTSNKSILGNILLEDGRPLDGADVTVIETGDSAITDSDGNFLIAAASSDSSLSLLIEKGEIHASAELTGLDSNAGTVQVQLTVKPQGDAALVAIDYVEIWARIVGDCEKYFRNSTTISQRGKVPKDLTCTLRFFASGDGRPLARIRGEIDVRSCNSTTWRKIAEGLTGTGPTIGYGDIDFNYIDNARNCEYRLIAPINDPQRRQFEVFITTNTYQDRQK